MDTFLGGVGRRGGHAGSLVASLRRWAVALAAASLGVGLCVAGAGIVARAGSPGPTPVGDARVRFVHAIPGAAALDIRIGDAPALPNVPFGVATEYVPVPAGTVALTASPAGRDPAEGGALVEAILTFGTGTSTTVAAAGSLDGIDVQVIADSPDPAPDPALVRVVNLAADAPALEVAPDGGEPLVGDVGYGDASVWVDIAAGDPDLELRAAGGTEVLLQLPPFTLGPGTRSTLFVIGSAGAGTLVVVPVVDAVDRDA